MSSYCACKKRYDEIMEEDRQSRRRERKQKENNNHTINEEVTDSVEPEDEDVKDVKDVKEEMNEYVKVVQSNGYSGGKYLDKNEEYELITVREIDTEDSYATVELTVYANGVVCDDADDPMGLDDILAAIGVEKPLLLFDDTDDEIYIRNHGRQLDYIIMKNEDEYEV